MTEPPTLVNTGLVLVIVLQRATLLSVRAVEVAPLMLLKLAPPLLLTCHCTAGAGEPPAAAVKVAVAPAAAIWLAPADRHRGQHGDRDRPGAGVEVEAGVGGPENLK